MFKGYIPMKGKRPLEEYKDRKEFYSYDWATRTFKEYGGVLEDNIIQVDFDDEDQSEILYKIVKDLNIQCNILKTDRGRHFYFINPGIDKRKQGNYNALGLKCDIGLGTQNAVIPLKIGDKTRRLTKCDTMESLPKWLYPLGKKELSFTGMAEGDGRNETLFTYILTLQSNGFTKDEIKEAIKVINKYILRDPLPDKEVEIILRDEAFLKESFFKASKLLHNKFAEYLKNEENIIKINSTLHIYRGGIYTSDITEVEKSMIKYIPGLTKSKRAEVLAYLELITPDKNLSNSNYLVLNNGLLDIKTNELIEFNVNHIAKNKVPINYNPAAYHETMDKTLNKIACNDKDLRALLEEMIGYTLLRRNELGKCFILTGCGSNGKSTILDVIKKFLGKENYSSISLDELNQRFKTAELYGKLANIGDDISNSYIQDNSVFKKLVTGETVNVERKGKDPFDFNNYSKLIFSANELPRINDTSNGLMRRLQIVPFNAKFSKNDPDFDPFIKDKLLSNEALEYLLRISIDGLKRVLKNRGFAEVKSVTAELQEYERLNNPVIAFMEEHTIENEHTKEVYLSYSTWCIENKLKALSQIQFSREICKHGFKTKQVKVSGSRNSVFIKDVV